MDSSGLPQTQADSLIALYSQGKIQEALNNSEALSRDYPDDPLLYHISGACFQALGQAEAAVKSHERAVAIKPDYAEAHNNLGITLQALGHLEAAVKSYEKALVIKPDFAETHNNLGIILKEPGQLEAAVKHYEQALAIKPDFAEAHSNLCELYVKRNMASELKNALTRAQKILPKDEPALLFRLAQLANLEKRLQDCRDILELISPDRLTPKLQPGYSELLAKTYDKLNIYQ